MIRAQTSAFDYVCHRFRTLHHHYTLFYEGIYHYARYDRVIHNFAPSAEITVDAPNGLIHSFEMQHIFIHTWAEVYEL